MNCKCGGRIILISKEPYCNHIRNHYQCTKCGTDFYSHEYKGITGKGDVE